MAQLALTHENIGQLGDGSAGGIINAAIREAVADLADRGEDEKPRKVEIILTMQQMDNGLVATTVEANAKVPRRKTPATIAKRGVKAGRLGMENTVEFQQYAPEDPHQRTMDEIEPR